MPTNPLRKVQTKALEDALKAADWLHGADEYKAGVALAKLLAGQIDDMVEAHDSELVKLMHMRSIPRYREVLETLGLTPTAHSRMVGGSAASAPPPPAQDEDDADEAPKETPAPKIANPLDALADEVTNVVNLAARRET